MLRIYAFYPSIETHGLTMEELHNHAVPKLLYVSLLVFACIHIFPQLCRNIHDSLKNLFTSSH